jgi:predicted DNA-binding transcriptional regulator AlpA
MTGIPLPADRPLLTVDEARRALGGVPGRSAFYAAVARGEVPGAVRVGRRVLLSTAALREWVGLNTPNANGVHSGGEHALSNGDSTVDRE